MADAISDVKLIGYTDVLLVDRRTNQVVEQLRQKNQITEPFARWVLTGNLCTHNPSSQDNANASLTIDSNSVSRFLGSKSIPRYQTVTSSCGNGEFGIYLLSVEAPIKADTQIPPYLGANLQGTTNKIKDAKPVLVYYGTATTQNAGNLTMAVDNGGCKWSQIASNPAFQTTYVKDDETSVTIKSIILGAAHGQLTNDGYSAHIAVRQSPSILPQGWDNSWDNATTAASNTLKAPTIISKYLVAPYLRGTIKNGRYGDGIYTTGKFGTSGSFYISYYDLASKQFEFNGAAASYDLAKVNGLTGEIYSTNPDKFVANNCSGGFAIGNGKAIRVDKGAETISSGGVGTARQVILRYQERLSPVDPASADNMTASDFINDALTFYPTENTTIPETIYKYCAPVMVAKRGATAEDDLLEVFVSLGVGTFSNSTLGPTGTGIEVHKFAIKIGKWRAATAADGDFSSLILRENWIIKYGRVAVLPYAIGRTNSSNSEAAETSTTGSTYTFGTYDDVNGIGGTVGGYCYYLPITHILAGTSLHDWTYTENDPVVDRVPQLCANSNFQPGLVLDAGTFERLGDCIFAMAPNPNASSTTVSTRIAMLTNDEGLNPVIVNTDQHWNETHSLVMSGLVLDTPIQKTAEQILVVRYTYAFEILPAPPARPAPFAVALPVPRNATSLRLTWNPTEHTERYILRRATISDFSDEVRVNVPSPILHPLQNTGMLIDTGLLPNKTYYYRLSAANGGGWLEPFCEDSQQTYALCDMPVAPSSFTTAHCYARSIELSWEWPQPTPLTDSSITDDITPYFTRFELQYQQASSGSTLTDALASDGGWIAVEDDDLLLKETTSATVSSLLPSQEDEETVYFFRIRARINPDYYENAGSAVSSWVGLSAATECLPEPVQVAGVEILRSDYNYSNGALRLTWNGQPDMNFYVRYKLNDSTVEWNPANVVNVATNAANITDVPYEGVDSDNNAAAGQWCNPIVQIWPYNDSYPLPADRSTLDATAAQIASEGYALARYWSGTSGMKLAVVTNNAYETIVIDGNNTDVSYGGFTTASLSRLFTDAEQAAMLTLHGDYDGGVTGADYALYHQNHLKIVLEFDNQIDAESTGTVINGTRNAAENKRARCIAWKMPFELYKKKQIGEQTSFSSSLIVKQTLYGLPSGSSYVPIGTLADVFGDGVEERCYVSNTLSTKLRPLVQTGNTAEFTKFKVEWELTSTTSGDNAILAADEELILNLYMWGIITDSEGVRFEFRGE